MPKYSGGPLLGASAPEDDEEEMPASLAGESDGGGPSEEEQNAAMDLHAAMSAKMPDKMEIASQLKRFIDLCMDEGDYGPEAETEGEPLPPVGGAPFKG